jgi:predicted metal-dependent phosphotriesterase family hydrolase
VIGPPLVDAHCHLWIHPARERAPHVADEEAALAELRDFRAAGGVAVIDCQPGGCGRDARVLRRLAEGSGVTVVCSTGFHLERYYEPGEGPWADPAGAQERFARELRSGATEEPAVRPRVVKCAFTGQGGRERELLRAAFAAAHEAGAGIVVHTEHGHAAEELAGLAAASGVDPGSVQLSHLDKRPDRELHRSLAHAGFVLGFDTFARPKYEPERRALPLMLSLLEDGLARQLTLGLDLADAAGWRARGGPGLRLLSALADRLREAGVDEADVRAVAGGNALRLVGAPEGART